MGRKGLIERFGAAKLLCADPHFPGPVALEPGLPGHGEGGRKTFCGGKADHDAKVQGPGGPLRLV